MGVVGTTLRFIGEQATEPLALLDPFGTFRALSPIQAIREFRTPTEQLRAQLTRGTFGVEDPTLGVGMGLASFLGGAVRAIGGFLQPAAAAVAPAAARAAPTVGRVAGRALQGGAGRALLAGGVGAGVGVGAVALAGDGVVAPGGAAQAAAAMGLQPVSATTGGRLLAMAPDGSLVTLSPQGRVVRPRMIVPAGQRLPQGATVVFVSADRSQIGLTIRRKRRAFASEINRVKRTLRGCQAVLAAAQPRKRRA